MEEKLSRIKDYLGILNQGLDTIEYNHTGLIDFVILEIVDRVCLYLNREDIPQRVERIIANIVNSNLGKVLAIIDNDDELSPMPQQVISSISDNGQSISYINDVKKYFASARDEEVFSGFSSLLSRYRRVSVVHTRDNEKSDIE